MLRSAPDGFVSELCSCPQYNYRNRGSLTFDPLTLVPIQVKLMNTELLTQKEVGSVPEIREALFVFATQKKCFYFGERESRLNKIRSTVSDSDGGIVSRV